MSDIDELLQGFRVHQVDDELVERIKESVDERTAAVSPGRVRRGHGSRRWLVLAVLVAVAAVVVLLANPFAGGRVDPATAFVSAMASLESSDGILHLRTSTRLVVSHGRFDLAKPLSGGQVTTLESWSTRDGYLKVRFSGHSVAVYTATPSEHGSYFSRSKRLTLSRWASAAERASFLNANHVFDPETFLRSYRRGLIRYLGRTSWQGKRALRFAYRSRPDHYTFLVDPKTYRPLMEADAYPINAGRGGTQLEQTIYTTFETLPRTPPNEKSLRFTPPPGTSIRRDDPAPYHAIALGGSPQLRAAAFLSSIARFEPSPKTGKTVRRENPPITSLARAIAIRDLADHTGQWILYRAPRQHSGSACYAFMDSRPDGRDVNAGSWYCDDTSRGSYGLNPSPDLKTWMLGGQISKASPRTSPVARIELVVGAKRYAVPILAGGYFIAAVPATGNATLHEYAANGRQLFHPATTRLQDFKARSVG